MVSWRRRSPKCWRALRPNGVVIEATHIVPDPNGAGRAEGPLRVAAYLPMDAQLEAVRQRLEEALWYLGRIQPLPEAEYKPVQQADWAEAWKQHYHPIAIGRRLMIVPAWLENPDPARLPIRIDPGMAFGTGTHPTTQLCLEIIEDFLDATAAHRSGERDRPRLWLGNPVHRRPEARRASRPGGGYRKRGDRRRSPERAR